MAKVTEILVGGVLTQVTEFDHTAQEIDDAVDKIPKAGAAPAGFGLGNVDVPAAPNNDANEIKGTGFWRANTNVPTTSGWHYVWHTRYAESTWVQYATLMVRNTGLAFRHCYNGEIGPWEWVNPPMQLGVEYRTIERYLGKPVYVKAVNARTMPAASGIANRTVPIFGTSNVEMIVDAQVIVTNGAGGYGTLPLIHNNFEHVLYFYPGTSEGNIRYYIEASKDMSSYTGVAIAWYTKTTD